MANPVCEVLLTDSPLVACGQAFADEAGAIIDFWGVVRATENGNAISGIEYEAHRAMAEHQLLALAEAAGERFPIMLISIRHRIGFVPAGEASLLVRLGAGHRAEAFQAAQWTIDELKKRIPIWKHPRGASGDATQSSCTLPALSLE
jgi:molybdopterin synthase catalytic subunit